MKPNNHPDNPNSFIRYSSLGFEMAAIIGGGTFAGYKIDEWLQHEFPFCLLIFSVLSVIGSIAFAVRNLWKK